MKDKFDKSPFEVSDINCLRRKISSSELFETGSVVCPKSLPPQKKKNKKQKNKIYFKLDIKLNLGDKRYFASLNLKKTC